MPVLKQSRLEVFLQQRNTVNLPSTLLNFPSLKMLCLHPDYLPGALHGTCHLLIWSEALFKRAITDIGESQDRENTNTQHRPLGTNYSTARKRTHTQYRQLQANVECGLRLRFVFW